VSDSVDRHAATISFIGQKLPPNSFKNYLLNVVLQLALIFLKMNTKFFIKLVCYICFHIRIHHFIGYNYYSGKFYEKGRKWLTRIYTHEPPILDENPIDKAHPNCLIVVYISRI